MSNLKQEGSTGDVSRLLASVQDDRSWRQEVTGEGVAQLNDLTRVPSADYEAQLHCFFEIGEQGTGFVGPGAAGDSSLCGKLERILRENDPALKGTRTLSAL